MPVEKVETYRISPTGDEAAQLRQVADYFLQKAPGVSGGNAAPAIPDECEDAVLVGLMGDVKPKLEEYWFCDRRKKKLGIADLESVDFSRPYLYCHKSERESELKSLLRHLRNAIAHGNLFVKFCKRDTLICLEDFERDKKPSALIVVNRATLSRWMERLKKTEH